MLACLKPWKGKAEGCLSWLGLPWQHEGRRNRFPWDCTETNFGIQLTVLKEKINTFFLRKNQLKILLSFVHPSVGERVL